MSLAIEKVRTVEWPDHLQLPETDGKMVENFLEHPQGTLLSESLTPVLNRLHPDGRYCIGHNSGIYWRLATPPEQLIRGSIPPDWFYVGNVAPLLDGNYRRSYVLWKERVAPYVVIEYASGNGDIERDDRPWKGKFWIYERRVRPRYYVIFSSDEQWIECYRRRAGRFERQEPNERGHYPIKRFETELGIWNGAFGNMTLPWMRWWDKDGNLLLMNHEKLELERVAKEAALAELQRLKDSLSKHQTNGHSNG